MSRWQFGLCVLMIPFLLAAPATAEANSRRSVATVIFCGLGGAVVGLSTLSFYGSPQDHTGNIYAGLGLGLVLGTAYVMSQPTASGSFDISQIEKPILQLSQFKELPRAENKNATGFPIASYEFSF